MEGQQRPSLGLRGVLGVGNPTAWGRVSEAAWGEGDPSPAGLSPGGRRGPRWWLWRCPPLGQTGTAQGKRGRGEEAPGRRALIPQGALVGDGVGWERLRAAGDPRLPGGLWGSEEPVSAAGTASQLHPELRLAISRLLTGARP